MAGLEPATPGFGVRLLPCFPVLFSIKTSVLITGFSLASPLSCQAIPRRATELRSKMVAVRSSSVHARKASPCALLIPRELPEPAWCVDTTLPGSGSRVKAPSPTPGNCLNPRLKGCCRCSAHGSIMPSRRNTGFSTVAAAVLIEPLYASGWRRSSREDGEQARFRRIVVKYIRGRGSRQH